MSTATDVKYGTCDECAAVCETLHADGGRWVCWRHGFVFQAANGDFYAVNSDGEQSPSFRTASQAYRYLGENGSASLLLLAGFLPVVLVVVFLAHLLGAMAAAVSA